MNTADILSVIPQMDNSSSTDYIGEDGLRYCAKCHKAKEIVLSSGLRCPCVCDCYEKQREAEKRAEEEKRIDRLRRECLPQTGKWDHRFDVAEDLKHIRIASRFVTGWEEVKRRKAGLLFYGNPGSGKTFTADCIANGLIDSGVRVLYKTAALIVAELTEKGQPQDEYLDAIRRAPLLIVDDLGAERGTSFALEKLCAVIDARTESGGPLVVTTNYTPTEMKDTTDRQFARLFSRLSVCFPVQVIGEDRRRQAQKENLAWAKQFFTG